MTDTREIRDLKNDPSERLAQYIAERVYVALGCASVPLLKRTIGDALRDDRNIAAIRNDKGERR